MDEDRAREAERIGRLIAELRERKGYNQEDLAREVGVGVGTVSRWERGLHQGYGTNVRKLAKALGVTPAVLHPVEPDIETQLDRIETMLSQLVADLEAQAAFRVDVAADVLEVMKRLDAMRPPEAPPRRRRQ